MNVATSVRRWRDWFPVPTEDGRLDLVRWVLLEAHRLAVTGALLTFVFVSLLWVATTWTFEMQTILTETTTVQTVLNTFLSGMILLVSIVVSINSIALSYDITSVETQEERVRGSVDFRRELGELTESGESPSDPASFLEVVSRSIKKRAQALVGEMEGVEEDIVEDIEEYATDVEDIAERLGAVEKTTGAEFAVLWKGMDFEYGTHLERSHNLKTFSSSDSPESVQERFDDLIEAFELFAIGREYFKSLYYTREVSQLSRVLLVVALPSILFNASTILAIDGGVLPEVWLMGLPPLQSFVAMAFTISLAPYLVLTSYVLRLATVARLTSSGGIFSLD